MNNGIYETIMTGIRTGIKNALNETKKTNANTDESAEKKYKVTYRTKRLYTYESEEDGKHFLKDLKVNPKNIEFKENDLDEYITCEEAKEHVHICDPYIENGKACFDIESDIPFNTPIKGSGPDVTLKKEIFWYLQGQISDGWGENGVGYVTVKKVKKTLFA